MMEELNQERLLKFMYSRHIVNWRNLDNFIIKSNIILQNKPVEELAKFDHDHFFGVEATDHCIYVTNIDQNSIVLDIGSGLGGPARYIALKANCNICGIEVQRDRYDYGIYITEKMGFAKKQIDLLLGDATNVLWDKQHVKKYTHIIAFLSILHMVQKKEMLGRLGTMLCPNGWVYIEDFCLGPNPAQGRDLRETVACPGLLSYDDCIEELKKGGLQIDFEEDLTKSWKELARQRSEIFCKAKESPEIINNFVADYETIPQASCLYENIYNLFERGAIRGIRIIGRRKP